MLHVCMAREDHLREGTRPTTGCYPALGKKSDLRPGVLRNVVDDRRRGAAHDDPSKRFEFRWVDFHVQQEGGDVNEIAGLRACDRFSLCPPTYFTGAGEDVGDRLLLAMVMNPGPVPPRTSRPRWPKRYRARAR